MLHKVSENIARMARNIVLNHPNAYEIQLWRKIVTRKDSGEIAGKPTMGGAGVLDTDDEDEVDWQYLGDGAAVSAEVFQPSDITDRNDASTRGFTHEALFLIEPKAKSGEEEWFDVRTHDVMRILIRVGPDYSDYASIAYEVVGRETTTDIPPYNVRFKCNRRDDLSFMPDDETPLFSTLEKAFGKPNWG